MEDSEFNGIVRETKARAEGAWLDILVAHGVDASLLTRSNRPCPACGGEDRFSFHPEDPDGFWFCRKCGHGDGFDLLGRVTGASFWEVLCMVRRHLGLPEVEPGRRPRSPRSARSSDSAVESRPNWLADWEAARPLSELPDDDPVVLYLQRRGLDVPRGTRALRSHPSLEYWSFDGEAPVMLGRHPAMLSLLTDDEGRPESLHRTYLTPDGAKADVPCVKKLVRSRLEGGLIRISEPGDVLGVAEGVETALAASGIFGVPVWSAVSVGGFSRFKVPEGVRKVMVFGDNDAGYAGQAGAYNLAMRLKRDDPGLEVEVCIPSVEGYDWADVRLKSLGRNSSGSVGRRGRRRR